MTQGPTNSEAGAAPTAATGAGKAPGPAPAMVFATDPTVEVTPAVAAAPDPTEQILVADYYHPHQSSLYAAPPPAARRVVAGLLIIILLVATGVLAYLAAHNDSVASKYRRLDQAEIAMVTRLNSQVAMANRNVATLDAQVRTLNAQLSSTQGHLADVANQKAKDVDLLKEAGQIASDLNVCIDQAGTVGQDFASSIETGQPSVQALQAEADRVATVCDQAQTDNRQLQATISGTS